METQGRLYYRQRVLGFCLGGVSRAPQGARRPHQDAPEATEEAILNALVTAGDMTVTGPSPVRPP
jgi:hypothetical protein